MMEKQSRGEEDIREIDGFLNWAKRENQKEIRRVTGIISIEGEILNVESLKNDKDIFTSMLYRLKEIVHMLISEQF